MSKKHNFIGSFINILKHNKDGSFRTQDDRRKMLVQIAQTLWSMGYKLDGAQFIRTRHIYKLVEHWKANGDGAGTLRNKTAALRWLMEKFNKPQVVPSNADLKIPKRQLVTHEDKSRELTTEDLNAIKDTRMQHSLKAQALFGLRVEESLKIKPFVADKSDQLFIRGGWSKGGRNRYIPIQTTEQKQWIEEAKQLVKYKDSSLIPTELSYKTYREQFDKACQRAGIHHCHGHRHNYAQKCYYELAGWQSPAKGGPAKLQLTKEQQAVDKQARLQISEVLGHSRINITDVYL